MNNVLLFVCILVLSKVGFSSTKPVNEVDDELVGVAVIFRHGNRAPLTSYPDDPYYDTKYWPYGYGQLLDEGKANHFKVGSWLRDRYNDFLSQSYSVKEIYVRSTDIDRCLQSAASNLAGLYYPQDQPNIWPETLPWDPIPIHTVPDADDEVMMKKECQNFDPLYEQTLHSEYFENILKEHNSLKTFVESKTGWNITDVKSFKTLYSVFYVYKMHNASYLPDWADQIDPDELNYLAGLAFASYTFTESLQRIKAGPFFNYLNNYLDGILDGTNPKFLMLSAHDTTVSAILNSYGSYDYHVPEFCSMIIWELYKTAEGDTYLKVLYRRNSETEILEDVGIGDCVGYCPFDQYKQIIKDITVDSQKWELLCNNFDHVKSNY